MQSPAEIEKLFIAAPYEKIVALNCKHGQQLALVGKGIWIIRFNEVFRPAARGDYGFYVKSELVFETDTVDFHISELFEKEFSQ
jgi:hypothetical protein